MGTEAVNDWNFWVYPAQVTIAEGKVYTTDTLDSESPGNSSEWWKCAYYSCGQSELW